MNDNAVVAASSLGLYAWSLPAGKMIWWKRMADQRAVPGGLAVSGERVFKAQISREQSRNENVLNVYDLNTGNEIQSLPLGKRATSMLARFSPDGQRMVYRAERTVLCADLGQMKILWRADLPKLRPGGHRSNSKPTVSATPAWRTRRTPC